MGNHRPFFIHQRGIGIPGICCDRCFLRLYESSAITWRRRSVAGDVQFGLPFPA